MTEMSNTTAVPRGLPDLLAHATQTAAQPGSSFSPMNTMNYVTEEVLTFDALRVQIQLYNAPRAVDIHAKPGVHGIHTHLPPLRY